MIRTGAYFSVFTFFQYFNFFLKLLYLLYHHFEYEYLNVKNRIEKINSKVQSFSAKRKIKGILDVTE